MKIIKLASVGSTNRYARDLAEAGELGPLWVASERQTAGRGRLERAWISQPGNLFASALYPSLPTHVPPSALSFAAALCVADTVAAFAGKRDVQVKWPNDVLLQGRKVAGILLENLGSTVICGIGINIAHSPETDRWPATHLGDGEAAPEVDVVLEALTVAFAHWRDVLARGGMDALRGPWTERAYGLGAEVVVETGGRRLSGRFVRLGANGELMLGTRAGTLPVVSGDVTYRARTPKT